MSKLEIRTAMPSVIMRFFFLFFTSFLPALPAAAQTPLSNAHAHNDYRHDRPLFDALAHGFTSVEADIHLIRGELYVAHDRPLFPSKKRTLRRLYLDPLQKHIEANGGAVYPGYDSPFYLMIDFKTEGEATYAVLKEQLADYEAWLSGPRREGPVRIFISGNRPVATIAADGGWPAGVDGRPADLEADFQAALMPVVSDHFGNHLSWDGAGEPDAAEVDALQAWIDTAHNKGMKVRLWATPETENAWALLQAVGVDLLNTDDLDRLRNFLIQKK